MLVAANGITGDREVLSRANFIIATALAHGIRIIVLTRGEIETLRTTADLVLLIKKKLCKLILTQSV